MFSPPGHCYLQISSCYILFYNSPIENGRNYSPIKMRESTVSHSHEVKALRKSSVLLCKRPVRMTGLSDNVNFCIMLLGWNELLLHNSWKTDQQRSFPVAVKFLTKKSVFETCALLPNETTHTSNHTGTLAHWQSAEFQMIFIIWTPWLFAANQKVSNHWLDRSACTQNFNERVWVYNGLLISFKEVPSVFSFYDQFLSN